MFSDIAKCLPDGSYKTEDSFSAKLLDIAAAELASSQFCRTHAKHCRSTGSKVKSDLEVLRLPCRDCLGRNMLCEKRSMVLMAHAKLHREQMTPLIIIETTEDSWERSKFLQYFQSKFCSGLVDVFNHGKIIYLHYHLP